jgi:hypothetical protein
MEYACISWRRFLMIHNMKVLHWALITASATLHPLSLSHCSSRRTEGGRGDLHCLQDRGKHRPGLLSEKALCRRRPVRTHEQEVVDGCQTCPFPGMIESAQLMVPQREVPVTPFDIGAGALKHLRKRFGRVLELVARIGFRGLTLSRCPRRVTHF